jgi:hypothetical protein
MYSIEVNPPWKHVELTILWKIWEEIVQKKYIVFSVV